MPFNPFKLVNKDDVKKNVLKLKKNNPQMTKEELCHIIIERKARWCAGTGAVTALPGVFPGVGTLFAVLGGSALDLTAVSYLMAEMILEMSLVYGRNLDIPAVSKEAAWVFISAVGSDAAGKGVSKAAVSQMSRQAFIRILQDVTISLGIRVSQRSLLKIIPLLGAILSGGVNYFICRKVGNLALNHYRSSHPEEWDGVTIDIKKDI